MLDIAFGINDFNAYIIAWFWIITILLIKANRLHDINFSAWWIFAFFVPLFGQLFAFALFFIYGGERGIGCASVALLQGEPSLPGSHPSSILK